MNRIDCKIYEESLSIDKAYSFVNIQSCGGIVLFIGTVRNFNKGKNVKKLSFDTYDSMAVAELDKIAEHIVTEYDAHKVAIHHRKGDVELGQIAVIIAVACIHRKAAFEACEYAIDTLKETVPIWKKEFLEDGSYWVGARP